MTLKMITTQYSLGKPEWHPGWESHTHSAFKGNEGPIERPKSFKMTGSQICFGSEKISYVTHTQSNYQQAPTDFIPSKPLKDRQELCATNYSLGDDKIEYRSAAMTQFAHPSKRAQPVQPQYKNYNQRIDIITGEVYDKNKRNSAYEGFSEEPQHRISQNKTNLPQDFFVVDPITGRKIIKKVNA